MNLSFVKTAIKKMLPNQWKLKMIARIDRKKQKAFLDQLQANIIRFYEDKADVTSEEQEVLVYLKENPVTVFPYDFQKKYRKEDSVVFLDAATGLRYVLHENKRLYFKRSYGDHQIKSLYHGLQLDQDPDSPHLYLTEDFVLNGDDVIADIGAAEGNFSLSNIEKVNKVYLFEYDPEWIEALEATFRPWKDKVVICNKFVSNTDSETTVSMDTFTKTHNEISFLKVDIEGEEANFLEGAQLFLQSKTNLKMAICTYHKQQDEKEFTAILKQNFFEVNASQRFMIFLHDHTIKEPFLRRGLLRAQKRIHHA
jgi:hypothetical protein